jgi:hypothetical protein
MAGSGGDLWQHSRARQRRREKKGLTCGAHMSVTGVEKRRNSGICRPEGKAPFSGCAKAFRDGWAKRGCGDLRGEVGQHGASWAGWAGPRREFKWKFDSEIQMNLEFGRTLRNFTRRFRRNLDMRIFPKFF